MIVIHRSFRFPECKDYSLVLRAMGIEHELERGVFGWRLQVATHDAAYAREQLRLYQLENRPRARPPGSVEPRPAAAIGGFVWAVLLVVFFSLQANFTLGIDWTAAGRVDVGAVRAGDWWRAVTALTLHVDVAHLVVNIGFGAIFGTLLAREIGPGIAWLLIMLGGTVGNFMNVLVQQPTHMSIGASTSVFAALGLLGAYLWTARRMLMHSWAARLSPVVGALILLAWLGTGDERTDIVAHLTGFVAGFVPGLVLGRLPNRPGRDVARQWQAGAVALLGLTLAWSIALANRATA
ncbi:MAG: rhomboid family intramembrane serine protease [Gammaproteobacteria bacterium]